MAEKPYPEFPLYWHKRGYWSAKIGGKTRNFGPHWKKALDKYLKEKDSWKAGGNPRIEGLTLLELVNRFLTSKKLAIDAKEITSRTWNDYDRQCKLVLEFFGKQKRVVDLKPEDFRRFKTWLTKGRKPGGRNPTSVLNAINRTRVLFKWAFDNNLIDKPVAFGTEFGKPPAKHIRRAKREGGPRAFEADALREIIESARQPLKAMILLGINCGFGQSDCSNLPITSIDLRRGWINYPRPKTEIDRRCPLWPETIQAISEAIVGKRDALESADDGLAFLTRRGQRWIREGTDEDGHVYFNDYLGKEFGKLLLKLGLKGRGSFYNLRHTFRTIADAIGDAVAIDQIMGHVDPSMGAEYREWVADERLRRVVDFVRAWLWHPPLLPPAGSE